MKLHWEIEKHDITRIKEFYEQNRDNEMVVGRLSKNIEGTLSIPSPNVFWREMVVCLLTTQARSGPNSPVSRFAGTNPFPLNYTDCKRQRNLKNHAKTVLANFGGIRRNVTISQQIQDNFNWLEKHGGWKTLNEAVRGILSEQTSDSESDAADVINMHLNGFGPKQSRNLLQSIGLTKYETPIDSRITRWLNEFGFPVTLSATALSDLSYYRFVSSGFQQLCEASEIYPCLMDAAIFSSYDV